MKASEKCNDCDLSPCSQCFLRCECDTYFDAIQYGEFKEVR